jgi:dipeptidyl-peptidase-4
MAVAQRSLVGQAVAGEQDFPKLYARTRRFALGIPSAFTIDPDGSRIAFLRTRGGTDPASCLWQLDVDSGQETLLADPAVLLGLEPDAALPDELIRQLSRTPSWGITSYSTDRAVRRACFTISGRLWVADLEDAARLDDVAQPAGWRVREITVPGSASAPRLDPAGTRVAYLSAGSVRILTLADGHDCELIAPDGANVTFGQPDPFTMLQNQGLWWDPDGSRLLVSRVDVSQVQQYWISDPANPGARPVQLRYPRVGTPNAEVSLWLVGLDGSRVAVQIDRGEFEYLTAVTWDSDGPLTVLQSRDQRQLRVLGVDPGTGQVSVRFRDTDEIWITLVAGVPRNTASGALIWACDRGTARRLIVDGEPVTPDDLQVREIFDVDGDVVLFAASTDQPEIHLWTFTVGGGLDRVSAEPGVHTGRRAGGITIISRQSLAQPGTEVIVRRPGLPDRSIASTAEPPRLDLRIELIRAGDRQIRSALLLPSWYRPGAPPLPVLVDSYGGAGQRVFLAQTAPYLVSQWFAEQGFAVIVADGRGTPGRDPFWERATRGDIATPVLEDQVAALRAIAASHPGVLDLDRVVIRGWSFGGFLAALAVLRRPDIFRAAVAGAPVTDQRLYNAHFKERYLGHPDAEPGNYDHCSLLRDAPNLRRPLMLIHGLADDNVVPAHTLRLSDALLRAGRPHQVLLLPGVTHAPLDETIAEKLLLFQLDFLTKALAMPLQAVADSGQSR